MNLDELIPDDGKITVSFNTWSKKEPDGIKWATLITGKDLKAAIRSEIAEQVKSMRAGLCSPDHDWEQDWEYKRCKRCNEVVSS